MPRTFRQGRTLMLAAVLAGLAACGRTPPPPAKAQPRAPQQVHTALVQHEGGGAMTAIPAVVQARDRAALAARIPASVVALPFREGDRVPAGAVVARLHDAALRSSLLAAESAAQAADADRARIDALLARGAATPREADESRARAAGAAAGVALARDNLAYAVLRAPFAGTVAARHANVGDVVSPGTTLIEIEGGGGLEARATVEGAVAMALRPGLAVQVQVDGRRDPLPATILAVSAAGDPGTHRFEVRATLRDAAGLRSGLFARLLVPSSPSATPRLQVPSRAVFQRGGLAGVFVAADSRAHLRWVALGASTGDLTEVRAGLAAGERVLVDPGAIQDGDPVTEAGGGSR